MNIIMGELIQIVIIKEKRTFRDILLPVKLPVNNSLETPSTFRQIAKVGKLKN